jgi:hypothetical protein
LLKAIDWKRGLTDPAYFASAALGIELHPGQRNWLENSTKAENVLVTGNRWGKSFVSAIKILQKPVGEVVRVGDQDPSSGHLPPAQTGV